MAEGPYKVRRPMLAAGRYLRAMRKQTEPPRHAPFPLLPLIYGEPYLSLAAQPRNMSRFPCARGRCVHAAQENRKQRKRPPVWGCRYTDQRSRHWPESSIKSSQANAGRRMYLAGAALRERSTAQKQNALSLIPHSWHVLAKELQQHDDSIGVRGEKRKREKMGKWVSLNLSPERLETIFTFQQSR